MRVRNWLDTNVGTVEAVFFEDVNIRLDLNEIWSAATGIVCNGVNKITQVDDA